MGTSWRAEHKRVPGEGASYFPPLRAPVGSAGPAAAAAATDGRREASQGPGSRVTNVPHSKARWIPLPLALWLFEETLGCFS